MTGFLPKIVASDPVHGRNAVEARLYALITQMKSLPWRSATMVGNAVDTMSYVTRALVSLPTEGDQRWQNVPRRGR